MGNNLEHRIIVLERAQRTTRFMPFLAIVLRPEQNGEPTEEQAAQIAVAQKEGRQVIRYCVI